MRILLAVSRKIPINQHPVGSKKKKTLFLLCPVVKDVSMKLEIF